MGTLYLVATPIGNLQDLSPRALQILRQVQLIAAEDTRVTRKLLSAFDLHTPLTSYFEHNKLTKLDVILSALSKGNVALVSDAGTPTINDPGYELVKAALQAGCQVSPIPGPSAPLAALAASGLAAEAFLYLGYLPRKSSEREKRLNEVASLPYTLIFLEAPHRLKETLTALGSVLGNRQIAMARELTKIHEQIWRGRIAEAREYYLQNEPRGEYTLVVAGFEGEKTGKWPEKSVLAAIKSGIKKGEAPSTLAKRLAEQSGWDRRELYAMILKNT
jgi:16S rRNA (cytidine1402-2'-O)-methyltransferase